MSFTPLMALHSHRRTKANKCVYTDDSYIGMESRIVRINSDKMMGTRPGEITNEPATALRHYEDSDAIDGHKQETDLRDTIGRLAAPT